MRIKHYPGKAVVDDPAWLEMDIPNSARGRLYEANWLDTQRNLSNSSSASSYDCGSVRGVTKLGQYQTLLDDVSDKSKSDQDSLYSSKNMSDSMRLKYHSDKCLSRINSKAKKDFNQHYNDDYYLPSQTRLKREQSVKKEVTDEHLYAQIKSKNRAPPEPKPRKKVPQTIATEQYKNVINDLEKQIKKSVRFNERKTEIGDIIVDGVNEENGEEDEKVYSEVFDWSDNNCVAIEFEDAPTKSDEEKMDEAKEETAEESEESQGRTSEWVEEQNKYFLEDEPQNTTSPSDESIKEKIEEQPQVTYPKDLITETNLNRNDSGYYESPKKIRQRIPPRKIYPSSSELSESASSGAGVKSDSDSCSSCENVEAFDIYKNGRSSPLKHPPYNQCFNQTRASTNNKIYKNTSVNVDHGNDFLIPRPKLIVPIHSYAVRKRRTGNLHKQSISCSDYDNVCSVDVDESVDNLKEGKD